MNDVIRRIRFRATRPLQVMVLCGVLSAVLLPIVSLRAAAAPANAPSADDIQTLRAHFREHLRPTAERSADAQEKARVWATALRPDGSWPDVDYEHEDKAKWKTIEHLNRTMALANDAPELRAAALRAFDFWLERDFQNPNWWYNVIGVPQKIGEIALLLEDDLSRQQLAGAAKILDRSTLAKNPPYWKTGANLVWLARNQIMRGVLTGEAAPVDEAFEKIWAEVKIADPKEEGVQADWSFHQHGAVLYFASYGAIFSGDSADFAVLARDTRWQIPPAKLEITRNFVLDGQQWATRGGFYEPGARGRDITRPKTAIGPLDAARALTRLAPERRDELDGLIARIENPETAAPLVGNRMFWKSDFMAHQRPHFYASARAHSTRVANTDLLANGEGKKSHHISDGANFLLRRGDEYDGIFPLWNWNRVPGTTAEQSPMPLDPNEVRRHGQTTFVGGVSDGRNGVMAADFERGALRARKAWFFWNEQYVCLGAGIRDPNADVATSINQTRLNGAVQTSRGPLSAGETDLIGVSWVSHDDVIYEIRDGAPRLSADERTANWKALGAYDKVETGGVFDLWLDHGVAPQNATYAYIVRPGATPDFDRADVTIVANTPALQAVWQSEMSALGAVFYEAGEVVGPAFRARVDQPCLLLCRARGGDIEVSLSNPNNQELQVNLELTRGAQTARATIELPSGARAGSSVTQMLSFG